MQNDLISRQAVEKAIKEFNKSRVDRLPKPSNVEEWEGQSKALEILLDENVEMLKAIQCIPTAYDVESIVQQLEQEKIININSDETHAQTWNNAIQSAIEHI